MLNRVLPRRVDNSYHGYKLALWLFALVVLMKLAISLNSIFNGYVVASIADGIPLDTYTPAGAQAFVSLFAVIGFSHLVLCLLCMVVLVRYRSLIPLMFAFLLLEHLGRKLILYFLPIAKTAAPSGFVVNLLLLAAMIIGFALSLWNHDSHTQASESH